jgi:hypothetical protein
MIPVQTGSSLLCSCIPTSVSPVQIVSTRAVGRGDGLGERDTVGMCTSDIVIYSDSVVRS